MKIAIRRTMLAAACLGTLLGTACSTAPAPAAKKEPEKPPEAVTGQSGLFRMYQKARTWASDAQVLKMVNLPVSGVAAEPGKSGAWQATFTSTSLGKMQTYTFSVVEQEDLHKGVFTLGAGSSWSGSQGQNTAFDIRGVSTDSDAALKTATEKAGDYPQKHPGMPISFLLEKTTQFTTPVWRVIWGESVGTSNFSIYVDASTGLFLGKMH